LPSFLVIIISLPSLLVNSFLNIFKFYQTAQKEYLH